MEYTEDEVWNNQALQGLAFISEGCSHYAEMINSGKLVIDKMLFANLLTAAREFHHFATVAIAKIKRIEED